MTETTDYHAMLFAHELRKQHSVPDDEKLADTLLNAQVDLNPHPVEAALFVLKSPLAKGMILTGGVWVGKTNEAGFLSFLCLWLFVEPYHWISR